MCDPDCKNSVMIYSLQYFGVHSCVALCNLTRVSINI